ncbi:MAG: hypothetical protein GDA56_10485 [Hormoscilla sp. GM7CHS1pb]|nr:hypothetical protein [Hormoscilla sp. GM7CHS1pb]
MNQSPIASQQSAAKINGFLARGIKSYRLGKSLPIAMSKGASGELYLEISQELIQERLSPAEHQVYVTVRDLSRTAAQLARQSLLAESRKHFQRASEYLEKHATSEELSLLGKSRLAQAEAYLESLLKNWQESQACIHTALESDEILEREYGYDIFHIHRIHMLYLLMRVESGAELHEEGINMADNIIQYLLFNRESLPVGKGWSPEQLEKTPLVLRNGMLARVASEYRILLAKKTAARKFWQLCSAWKLFEYHPSLREIYEWGEAKNALLSGDLPGFLENCASFLAAGRRETLLWYTMVLDFCTCCQELRPLQTQVFLREVAADAERMKVLPDNLLPSGLRTLLENVN